MHGAPEHDRFRETQCGHRHHEGEGGAKWDAFLKKYDSNRNDCSAASIHRYAECGGDGNRENSGCLDEPVDSFLWHIVVDECADGDAHEYPEPDLFDHADGFVEAVAEACFESMLHHLIVGVGRGDDVGFEMFVQFQSAEDRARYSADQESAGDIGDRYRYTEFANHENYEIFVDDRGSDQKGEGDSQRYTGFEQADEDRDRRAGAKRCDRSEEGGDQIAPKSAATHPPLEPMLREPGADNADGKDHDCEEQKDLYRVVEEEMNRSGEARLGFHPDPFVDQAVDEIS